MSIEDVKIIIGIICIGIFQFFSLKFSYWKLKDQFKILNNTLKRLDSTVHSIDRKQEELENRVEKLEKIVLPLSELDVQKITNDMKTINSKNDMLLKFIEAKRKEFDKNA